MILFERTHVDQRYIFEAIRGMRLSYYSQDQMDSVWDETTRTLDIGPADRKLLSREIKLGDGRDKCLNAMPISVEITAPESLWRQAVTYRFPKPEHGDMEVELASTVVMQSSSFMHRTASHGPFMPFDFDPSVPHQVIDHLNRLRDQWVAEGAKRNSRLSETWTALVNSIPAGYLYTRHIMTNYGVERNRHIQRTHHRFGDWSLWLKWQESLPHAWLITESFQAPQAPQAS